MSVSDVTRFMDKTYISVKKKQKIGRFECSKQKKCNFFVRFWPPKNG